MNIHWSYKRAQPSKCENIIFSILATLYNIIEPATHITMHAVQMKIDFLKSYFAPEFLVNISRVPISYI